LVSRLIINADTKAFSSPHYNYIFNVKNGKFARWGKNYNDDPFWSPFGPEIADIEISTGDCSGQCRWCYKSNKQFDGEHMDYDTFKAILGKFPPTLTQVALGLRILTLMKT